MLLEGGGRDINLRSEFRGHFHELRRLKLQHELSNASLTSQLAHARSVQKVYKNDRACLLSCVCLVAGSLFASQQKIQQLRLQKQLLLRLKNQQLCSIRAQDHSSRDGSSQGHCTRGILYFRILAIVVLAVCRLRRLKSRSLRLSCHQGDHGVPPYIGLKANRCKSVTSPSEGVVSNRDIARWLRSESVLLDVRECFSGLQSSLDMHSLYQHSKLKLQRSTSSHDTLDGGFETLVSRCLLNFLNKINCHFPIL